MHIKTEKNGGNEQNAGSEQTAVQITVVQDKNAGAVRNTTYNHNANQELQQLENDVSQCVPLDSKSLCVEGMNPAPAKTSDENGKIAVPGGLDRTAWKPDLASRDDTDHLSSSLAPANEDLVPKPPGGYVTQPEEGANKRQPSETGDTDASANSARDHLRCEGHDDVASVLAGDKLTSLVWCEKLDFYEDFYGTTFFRDEDVVQVDKPEHDDPDHSSVPFDISHNYREGKDTRFSDGKPFFPGVDRTACNFGMIPIKSLIVSMLFLLYYPFLTLLSVVESRARKKRSNLLLLIRAQRKGYWCVWITLLSSIVAGSEVLETLETGAATVNHHTDLQVAESSSRFASSSCFAATLLDSYGDGWNGALLTFTSSFPIAGTVAISNVGSSFVSGLFRKESVCLPCGCFVGKITTSGVSPAEVSWTLKTADGVRLIAAAEGESVSQEFCVTDSCLMCIPGKISSPDGAECVDCEVGRYSTGGKNTTARTAVSVASTKIPDPRPRATARNAQPESLVHLQLPGLRNAAYARQGSTRCLIIPHALDLFRFQLQT